MSVRFILFPLWTKGTRGTYGFSGIADVWVDMNEQFDVCLNSEYSRGSHFIAKNYYVIPHQRWFCP